MLDRAIAPLFPGWAAARAKARYRFSVLASAYDAARPSRLRKFHRDYGSGDSVTRGSSVPLRTQARHLERNNDIARGALGVLVRNIVGPNGIGVEPQPRRTDGTLHEEFAQSVMDLWRKWCERPEVTKEHDYASAQRLMARTWIRDGELLKQYLLGNVKFYQFSTGVPYAFELIEADQLPIYYDDPARGITQGVEKNAWGQALAYHVLKHHPGDITVSLTNNNLKRVPSNSMAHIKLVDRIRQTRGVSVFASVIARLEDIKDYEDSERIAAKVAASMAAVIKKGTPEDYAGAGGEMGGTSSSAQPRELSFRAGAIFDDLRPGESIDTIDTKRPNSNLEPYRNGQLRAAAGGMSLSFSSLSRNYNGTYSAQRQELVEGWSDYAILSMEFVHQSVRPDYQNFIAMAVMSGQLKIPADLDRSTLDHALYIPPSMPWINPLDEAEAWLTMEQAGYMSGPEIIRKRGANPREVMEQEANWRRKAADQKLDLTSDPAAPGAQARARRLDIMK